MEKWYKCSKCGFIYSRHSEQEYCVDCGAYALEEPTQEEINKAVKKINSVRQENWENTDLYKS